jgi:DNA-binding transcriptional LysR family regulator
MPQIRTLSLFLTVARCGSFSAAGAQAGLTPAAVGLQMRSLEHELGRALFDRGPRSMSLTHHGQIFITQAQELVARWETMAESDQANDLRGTVQVGALVSALMGEFADALWELKRQHPALDVRLFAGLSATFFGQVERGELDAAVVAQPPSRTPAGLIWSPLYVEPMVLVVPRKPHFDWPSSALDMLRKCPFLRFDRDTWTGALVDRAIDQCGVKVRDELELNSVEAILALVRQGFGISIVPKLRNIDWGRDRQLLIVPLPRVSVQRHVGLLERQQHPRQRFTAAIKGYFDTH